MRGDGRAGASDNDLFAFLTTEPDAEVGAIHHKAMPVILREFEELAVWMTADAGEAMKLQHPLPDGTLQIVARWLKKDGPTEL